MAAFTPQPAGVAPPSVPALVAIFEPPLAPAAAAAAAPEDDDQQTLEDVPVPEPQLDAPADRLLPQQAPWQLDDTLRLLQGFAQNRDAVRRKLRAILGDGLSDAEYWAKSQLYTDDEWSGKKIDTFHRVIINSDLLQCLQVWMGPEVFPLVIRPPSSSTG